MSRRSNQNDSAEHGAVLALDEGTTNTKALLIDAASGVQLAAASRPLGIAFPAPGQVEQDPVEIWQATVLAAADCLKLGTPVAGIAIANQRESVVCWSKRTGKPLGPMLGWQDARTASWCTELATANPGAVGYIRDRTGLTLDPMYSAPKMRVAIDKALASGVAVADIAVGTVESWLVWSLTGEHLTEVGNASRTLLLDLTTCTWDQELLDLFGIPRSCLPEVRGSDEGFGRTRDGSSLPAGLPVVAVLADSHAAMYAQGCLTPGTGKATFGTGSSVMTPTASADPAPAGITTTLAWQIGGVPTYAREGNVIATGSALDWVAGVLGAPHGVSGGAFLTELAEDVDDSGGVCLVPAFSGLGSPYWDRGATGVLTGVTAGTSRAQVARAALEAVVHQVTDVIDAVESDGGARIRVLRADGGATASGLLMQLQADAADRQVQVGDTPEASARGAAALARRTLGFPTEPVSVRTQFQPSGADPGPARQLWAQAVQRARGQAVLG